MRVFILILIIAISFGGFSTAAHAFADVMCNPPVSEHIHDLSDGQQGCAEHTDMKGSSDGICLDCHHGCASHAIVPVAKTPDFPSRFVVILSPNGEKFTGEYLFSLLRPPKTLV